jgi:hypothetical protein
MRIREILAMLGAILLLVGAILKMSFGDVASYIYTVGAALFAVMQFMGRVRGGNFAVRRLVTMQTIGSFALVAAGVLMFTHHRNEWIVAMSIGAFLQLYTSFRIPQELEK